MYVSMFIVKYFHCVTQGNRQLKDVQDFRTALRRFQHAAIFECFRAFNRKGGAIVPLQTGGCIYFARACILAIFADQPAARKCTLTGSACPVCFTPEKHMALADQEPRHALYRTVANMKKRKRIFLVMRDGRAPKAGERAVKRAKRVGVNLDVDNAWCESDASDEGYVFGPSAQFDNVYQNTPQVTLHGSDEGTTLKTNKGVLEATIVEAKVFAKLNATEVYTASVQYYKVRVV
jgi:hypothetical protein